MGGPGVCLVIKRAEPMFNKKVEVLNRYLCRRRPPQSVCMTT